MQQSARCQRLLRLARGEREEDKENDEPRTQYIDDILNSSKTVNSDLKEHLTEEQIFKYPVSHEKFSITIYSVKEYENSKEYISNIDIDNLKSKLLDRPELDFIEDSDDSVKDKNYVPSDASLSDSEDNDVIGVSIPTTSTHVEAEPSTSQYIPNQELTKTGRPRIRKKYNTSLKERSEEKHKRQKSKHQVINAGEHHCRKRCSENISELDRENINQKFWDLNWREQKIFIAERIICKEPIKRKKTEVSENHKRKITMEYSFNVVGKIQPVCKEFFLNTLGFKKDNHSAINMALRLKEDSATIDKRGTNAKKKIDRNMIIEHIMSYNPSISHYRREHAPNRRYLPSEITVQNMYDTFCETNGKICSYDLYRETVKSLNISFTKLGHEECDRCESYKIHNPDMTIRHIKCSICREQDQHLDKAVSARNAYQCSSCDGETVCYSADLQKVIMLPRMESIKSVVFCPRLIAFNESFVPVRTSKVPPIAVLWHEAISGRKKEDILSSFRMFFMEVRDAKNITLWLDNCAGQNKNWCLFSYIVYLINSGELNTDTITLNFFEPGHTFMSADSFHHQVELSMKKMVKIYDFRDFKNAVESANSGKVHVHEMKINDFFTFNDCAASRKISMTKPRPYLNDMVQVKFTKGEYTINYKTSFEGESINLDFIKAGFLKNGFPLPTHKEEARGITSKRKRDIIQRLAKLMPPNRVKFWEELPVNDGAADLINDYDI